MESSIMEEAEAVTGFDASGSGLISLELDGQVRQLLGRLRAEDQAAGIKVHRGDRLLVEDFNAAKNYCVVSRLSPAGALSPPAVAAPGALPETQQAGQEPVAGVQ
jgi:hypothetical protein